jgi:hypothetical protein
VGVCYEIEHNDADCCCRSVGAREPGEVSRIFKLSRILTLEQESRIQLLLESGRAR